MVPKGRWCHSRLSTVFVLFLCVAFLLLLLVHFSGFGSSTVSNDSDTGAQEELKLRDSHDGIRRSKDHPNKWEQLFNHQQEVLICKQPKFSSVTQSRVPSDKAPTLSCGNKRELMTVAERVVLFDRDVFDVHKLSRCEYRAIDRITDDHFQYNEAAIEKDPAKFGKTVNHDFFRVKCFLAGGKKGKGNDYDGNADADFDQLFAQISPSKETLEGLEDSFSSAECLNMSVLILGLDSMSHLSYQRNLPLTYNYLKTTLGAVIMNGYNILGDGTAATVVPLLTGKNMTELPEIRRHFPDSGHVDQYPLIWTEFDHNGYVTLFAEDEPSLGMFNLRMKGFENAPTDHYMRPFWQAVWDSSINSKSEQYCLGGRPKHQYMLNYVKDFFAHDDYKKTPKFAFSFLGELSHLNNEPVKYLDKDLSMFLRHVNTQGYLDNTLLVIMGDHGARHRKVRHTVHGKLEERLPFMSFVLPTWFQRKYPKAMRNLRTNADRLTTAYDIYELMLDLLDHKRMNVKPKYDDRGISLFKEIPSNRTCASAGIELHWCTCLSWTVLPTDNLHVVKAAHEVMDFIKRQTEDFHSFCSPLQLKRVVEGRRVLPNEKVLKYFNRLDDDHRLPNFTKEMAVDAEYYQVTIVTSPNNGHYEATVLYKPGWLPSSLSHPYHIMSDISRIDEYGNQPYCIMDRYPELMKYCYCADYKEIAMQTSRKPKFFMKEQSWIS